MIETIAKLKSAFRRERSQSWERLAPIIRAAGLLRLKNLRPKTAPAERVRIEPDRLATLLHRLKPAAERARLDGLTGNIWTAARVGRDEVRNTKLLGWIIDPGSPHGLGREIFSSILDRLAYRNPGQTLPTLAEKAPYTVLTEHCSFGSREDRFDLLLTLPTQIVLIEAKIRAAESKEQLRRYAEAAEKRRLAMGLDKAFIVSLTPQGQSQPDALVLSWKDVAAAVRRITAQQDIGKTFSGRMLRHYADHCRKL